jgi:hypothetical protein
MRNTGLYSAAGTDKKCLQNLDGNREDPLGIDGEVNIKEITQFEGGSGRSQKTGFCVTRVP